MATPVILPKQGNSVESCIIAKWLKQPGDAVALGEPVCEVETDKATVEVEATEAGVLLAQFAAEGDDVPVMTAIAAIGAAGEDASSLAPAADAAVAPAAAAPAATATTAATATPAASAASAQAAPAPVAQASAAVASSGGSSPRARTTAAHAGIEVGTIIGSGPQGLVVTADVQAAAAAGPRLTVAARAAGGAIPALGTGIGGRVTVADRASAPVVAGGISVGASAAAYTDVPVKGIRKIIAERMIGSLAGSAQLTLTATARADALQAWRVKVKAHGEGLGLPPVTINDLVLFAVSRVLPRFPALNAHWQGTNIRRYSDVHIGMAVDTEKGLLVPVIPSVNRRTLADLAVATKSAAKACIAGKATPDQLQGSTFSVTNVGALGIETFTPVLNTPEVAILGVGAITLRPYAGKGGDKVDNGVQFIPSLHLSLTIDHQAVDGAPAARFLQALVAALEHIDVVLAS